MLQITVIIGLTTRYKYLFKGIEYTLDVFMDMNMDRVRSGSGMKLYLPHIDLKEGIILS